MKLKSLIYFILILNLVTVCPSFADGDTEDSNREVAANNIDQLSAEDLANNIDQIRGNPDLISRLSGTQIREVATLKGVDFLKQNGILDQLDPLQVEEAGIYDDAEFITDFSSGVTNKKESDRTGISNVLIEGTDVSAQDTPEGRRFEGLSEFNSDQSAVSENMGAVTARQGTLIVEKAKGVEHRPIPPNPAPSDTPQPQPPTGPPPPKPPTRDDSSNTRRTADGVYEDETDPTRQSTRNAITQAQFSNVRGFEVRGNNFKVDRAESIIFTFDDGRVEISTDVEGFESDSNSFSVQRARQVTVDGVTVENVVDTEFWMGRARIGGPAQEILGLPNESKKVLIINPGIGVFPVTDRSGNSVLFTAKNDSVLAVSFDDEDPLYLLQNGQLNITPDTYIDEPYKEQIDASTSRASTIINKAVGVIYVKLTPPSSYTYIPTSIEKTFALQATQQTHEIFFSKEGRKPLKNNCSQCTTVDFVGKLIKLNGILDYKRYFFNYNNNKPNLIMPNLNPIFQQQINVTAILKYDNQLLYIEKLHVLNGTQFALYPTNWIELKAYPYQNNAEMGYRLKRIPKQNMAQPLLTEIAYNGIPPLILTKKNNDIYYTFGGAVFVNHQENSRFKAFFEWLRTTLAEVIV